MGQRTYGDDFVLTISDNEELPASDAESEDVDINLDFQPSDQGTKRKREEPVKSGHSKTKKQKTKQSKKQSQQLERKAQDSESESETEEQQGVQDGAIDSDFEFDLGIDGVLEEVDDFDGWGVSEKDSVQKNGNKKGVDIDQIIARRAAKKGNLNTNATAEPTQADEDDDSDMEADGDDDVDMPNFDDDELVAPDTFGAGAGSEVEDEASDGDEDDEDDGDDDGSDSDSVASPTAHPDDLASDHSDAESQTSAEDAEESAKRAAFFAPESQPTQKSKSPTSFQQFSLSRPILRGLAGLSWNTPTPIQSRTIPVALAGHDVVGSAVTGSGKTAAFLLPILERLLYRPRKVPTTRVAILMPTRELAVQCYNVATALARFTDITFAQVVGGFSLREQEAILKKRPDVVIATPGRFIDHMRNSASFAVENIEILVLDEADRMLETGFEDELNEILKTIPKGRQTMLFSATMTDSIDKLVGLGMNRPVRVSVDAKKSTVSGLTQEFIRLRPGREDRRLATLCVLVTKFFTERCIIFFRQKKEAHRVRIIFGLLGLKAGELHGSMSQEQRIAAVTSFREGKTTHLLATDLASRGLDIKNVATVVNYEAPQTHEIYLHRVGRTARAGRSGRACTIAAEPDRKVVKAAVKAARTQGAKVVSRVLESGDVDEMHGRVEEMADEIEAVLAEEKEEKVLAQSETQIARGENLLKHADEIMARPRRTWFETQREKDEARNKGRMELNGPQGTVSVKTEKRKLSNKDKKRLDDRRERLEGKMWQKGKGSEEKSKHDRKERKKAAKVKSGKAKAGAKKMRRR